MNKRVWMKEIKVVFWSYTGIGIRDAFKEARINLMPLKGGLAHKRVFREQRNHLFVCGIPATTWWAHGHV